MWLMDDPLPDSKWNVIIKCIIKFLSVGIAATLIVLFTYIIKVVIKKKSGWPSGCLLEKNTRLGCTIQSSAHSSDRCQKFFV